MTNRSQKSAQRTGICHFSLVICHLSFLSLRSARDSVVRFGVQALACYGRRAASRLRSKPGTNEFVGPCFFGCGGSARCSSVFICGFILQVAVFPKTAI